MFFKKNKELVLNFYTDHNGAYNFFKPKESKHFWPEWWKKLPRIIEDDIPRSTMKTCDGFVRLYKNSLIIPLWSDLFVEIYKDENHQGGYNYQFADQISSAVHHNREQFVDFLPGSVHLKIHNPWLITCDEEVNFLIMAPFWNHPNNTNLVICPGMVEFKYQVHCHINTFFLFNGDRSTFTIEAGSPITQIIPITERPVVIKHHLLSRQEMLNLHHRTYSNSFFVHNYKRIKKIIQKEKLECPMK